MTIRMEPRITSPSSAIPGGRGSVTFIYSCVSAGAPRLKEGGGAVQPGGVGFAFPIALSSSARQAAFLTCCFEKSCQPGGPSPGCYVQGCSPIIGGTVYMGITLKSSPQRKELVEGSLPL